MDLTSTAPTDLTRTPPHECLSNPCALELPKDLRYFHEAYRVSNDVLRQDPTQAAEAALHGRHLNNATIKLTPRSTQVATVRHGRPSLMHPTN